MPESAGWIINFYAQDLTPADWTALAGGKGANLARLAQAGMPVPDGFILTTQAYRDYIAANQLEERILAALPADASLDPDALEASSQQIRALFAAGRMPPPLKADLHFAYAELGMPPVAVRSSATAEDTLELSFAGQQDTYLNIIDDIALRNAVVDCWSSLWTARAIGYRTHNGISHAGLALAVVVQRMVSSDVSGVLFTANPLTGLRSEMVVDAAFGPGEALVSGQVEPDHYIVDAVAEKIIRKNLGAKTKALHGQSGGGTAWQEADRSRQQALPDEQILNLARLGRQIENHYSLPQDIEWAWAGNRLYILQSRPITSLYPTPEGMPAEPLKVMASFGAIQGLLAPITPLGRDTIYWIVSIAAGLLNFRVTAETQTLVFTAGERLWMNITTPMRNSIGRKLVRAGLGMIEPSVQQAVIEIWDDPRLRPGQPGISWRARRQIAHLVIPLAWNVLLNLAAPSRRRAALVADGEKLLDEIKANIAAINQTGRARLARVAGLLPDIVVHRLPPTFLRFVSGVAGGMASLNALNKLADSLPGSESDSGKQANRNLVLEITRGVPHNPTTEMDLILWQTAQGIQRDASLLQYFQSRTPEELGHAWKDGTFISGAKAVLQPFIDLYGGRGLAEIDLGRERWVENPTPVIEALVGYLKMADPAQAPDINFQRSADSALAALGQLTARLRASRGGWFKARLAIFFASRMRQLLGMRENPKFFAVRLFNLIRQELLSCGKELAADGEIDKADDLFFLTYKELEELAKQGGSSVLRERITSRRHAYDLEMHRRQIPRLLLSDGRAFYAGIQATAGADSLAGSPVSPGSVEGNARVVLNPHQAGLLPGEIMVCPGTDPSWTPLFLTAGGLIMEVGGMMTHGAVVAREYGIPAVVGVDSATTRLKTGMRVRLDGSSGQIVILT
ncbi:MAG: PEP/pyruvate-binding domain-containing protein [Bellilinea sp.]